MTSLKVKFSFCERFGKICLVGRFAYEKNNNNGLVSASHFVIYRM